MKNELLIANFRANIFCKSSVKKYWELLPDGSKKENALCRKCAEKQAEWYKNYVHKNNS